MFASITISFIVAWAIIFGFNCGIKLRCFRQTLSTDRAGVLEQHYSNGPESYMKQCSFKDDHYDQPTRTIHVSLSIICLAILSENIHYLKAPDFVLDKTITNHSFLYILLISVCRHASEIQGFAFTPDLVQDLDIKNESAYLRSVPYSQKTHSQFLVRDQGFTIG